jgi:mono/diheme cytochrome c family protein
MNAVTPQRRVRGASAREVGRVPPAHVRSRGPLKHPAGAPDSRAGAPRTRRAAWLVLALLAGACRQDMAEQPRYDPLEASRFFPDGQAARPRVAGTVARGELADDTALFTGKAEGRLVDKVPVAVTPEVLARGRERFDIYCSPCHDRVGTGKGMIVRRGYRQPPSLHDERLRQAPAGHFFDVVTNGFGVMPAYAAQVPVHDRWAIVAYIRALQRSQHATLADVPPAERRALETEGAR